MRRRRLVWQLYPPIAATLIAALFALEIFGARALRTLYLDGTAASLLARARLIERSVPSPLPNTPGGEIDTRIKQLGEIASVRITVIRPDGVVIADSAESPDVMDNHAERPEVVAAMRGQPGQATRFSHTIERTMMYMAVPRFSDDGVTIAAIIRTAVPVTPIEEALSAMYVRATEAGLAIALLAAVSIWIVSRRITKPLEQLDNAADRFAHGDFTHRIPASGSVELVRVAESMNRMAAQLDDRIRAIVDQRKEQDAVLASMTEGVLAVGRDERVITLNAAASRLLDIESGFAGGRSIYEVVRGTDVQRCMAQILHSAAPVECDCSVNAPEIRNLQIHGAPIVDADGERTGSVIVLNDVTRLRRLESMRRDFVANVSHELKTPITSIKGFLETLIEGKVEDPEDRERFLAIALRQADRLSSIIDDLLSLARIEQEEDQGGLPRQAENIKEVLVGALEVCRMHMEAKSVEVRLECDPSLEAVVNAPLLEQALVNLIHNAVKYSVPGSEVFVTAAQSGERLSIDVRDSGSGIEAHHLPRLFERFYRADKARSRQLGGTGLGLAIVKHIASAHGGTVTVRSTPGTGSVFTISIPNAPEPVVRNARS